MACTESWSLPGDNRNSTGLPKPSTMAWIFVFKPPFVRPTALLTAPFYCRLRSDVLLSRSNLLRGFPHRNHMIVPWISFPILPLLSISEIANTRSATVRNIPATLAIALLSGLSISCRSVPPGYLLAVSLSSQFPAAAITDLGVSIPHLSVHIVS